MQMVGQQNNTKLQVVVGKKDKMMILKESPVKVFKEDDEKPKFDSVHRTSTFDATFGRWYANYVPLSTKKIQSILGKEKVSVFHVGNAEYESDITQVQRIVGKKGTLSTFTSVDKGEKLAKGRGIQSGGGIIYQIEGTLLVASTRDMQSMPDNTGRRWIPVQDLAGKVAGGKMYEELKKSIERKKMDRYSWMKIEREEEEKWQDKVDYYGDDYTGGFERKEKEMKKIMGPIKRKWIKDYIDMGYKIIDKYKPQIKRHILSQKDKPSQHGWNEILVNQIKVKDVFLLSRNDYPNIKKAAEKIATGQVTVGTPGKFRKWYNERGGIINEGKQMKEARGTCWVGYKQVGMKDKGGRKVPNCVKETTEIFYEENGQSHGYTLEYLRLPEDINEAEYQGRKVKLGKPMQGDVKKFKVYVKNPAGNVVKVNFGHGGTSAKGKTMKIRKSNPDARRSFRARHNCDSPGPRHKARYWSCRKW